MYIGCWIQGRTESRRLRRRRRLWRWTISALVEADGIRLAFDAVLFHAGTTFVTSPAGIVEQILATIAIVK